MKNNTAGPGNLMSLIPLFLMVLFFFSLVAVYYFTSNEEFLGMMEKGLEGKHIDFNWKHIQH